MKRSAGQVPGAACTLATNVFVAAIVLGAPVALAAGEESLASSCDAEMQAQNPAPIKAIEIEGGYRFDFRDGADDDSYYSVMYKGSLVTSEGTPFKSATGLDLETPALKEGAGDRNNLTLQFEHGATSVGGDLFEANGVKPLSLRGLERLNLRGTALLAGDTDSKTYQAAVGLETPPFRLPGLRNREASNWIVFGVNGQRQESLDSNSEDDDFGLITYRAFLGKAFGWRKSADVGATASRIVEEVRKQAPTLEDAKALSDRIKPIAANQRSCMQQFLLDTVLETDSAETWDSTLKDAAEGQADAITDQPTLAVYAEASGWYSFAGSTDSGKLRSLFTLTLDYWPMPSNDQIFLRLRYENGYERALPTMRMDHVLLTINARL
jgi:hypothetical protein